MTDHQQRVSDIAACRRNEDSMSRDNAARNLMDDVPAYWPMPGGTSLGLSAQVAATANFHGSLKTAMDEKADGLVHRNVDIAREVYDNLIPLNMTAVEELDLLYRKLGTWRDRHHLLSREETAITCPFAPAWPNHDSPEITARLEVVHAGAQARLAARRAPYVAAARVAKSVKTPVAVAQDEVA